jgi:oxygen-dependent protoporphyrinogen oxidase
VGFIVPRSEHRAAMAGTWVSSKWAHRAPSDDVVMRLFFGGAGRESLVDMEDGELVALAARELGALMGVRSEPLFTRVFRFRHASPQPVVGHLDRIAHIRALAARSPGLHFTGSGFSIGIPDCVRLAEETAAAVLDRP